MSPAVPVNRDSLAQAICRVSYLEGDFWLRSGQYSDHYFDEYLFEGDPRLLHQVAESLRPLVPRDAEILGGLELGGVPLATALGLVTGLPMVFVRKTPKGYGTMKLAEGPAIDGKRLVVIEDVVTSGGQVVESTKALRERGARVDLAICVIDRESGGAEALAAAGIELHSLFGVSELSEWLPR